MPHTCEISYLCLILLSEISSFLLSLCGVFQDAFLILEYYVVSGRYKLSVTAASIMAFGHSGTEVGLSHPSNIFLSGSNLCKVLFSIETICYPYGRSTALNSLSTREI